MLTILFWSEAGYSALPVSTGMVLYSLFLARERHPCIRDANRFLSGAVRCLVASLGIDWLRVYL